MFLGMALKRSGPFLFVWTLIWLVLGLYQVDGYVGSYKYEDLVKLQFLLTIFIIITIVKDSFRNLNPNTSKRTALLISIIIGYIPFFITFIAFLSMHFELGHQDVSMTKKFAVSSILLLLFEDVCIASKALRIRPFNTI